LTYTCMRPLRSATFEEAALPKSRQPDDAPGDADHVVVAVELLARQGAEKVCSRAVVSGTKSFGYGRCRARAVAPACGGARQRFQIHSTPQRPSVVTWNGDPQASQPRAPTRRAYID
jgi:hypothetical protein